MRAMRWSGALTTFLAMSGLAGLLVAVAVTPAVAVAGEATSGAVSFFEDLPSYLDIQTPQQVSSVYATKDGQQVKIASFYAENRTDVASDAMAESLKRAAIDTEDPRFEDEGGIDVLGTVRGVAATVVGGDVQGGSSITQQYVKNVLVQQCEQLTGATAAATQAKVAACYQDAAGVTPQRKLQEMRYAIAVDKKYTKDQILTGYLNLVGLGGRVYGAEAGAEYYFGVHAKDLSLPQSATLVAILNNPANLRIDEPDDEDNGAANGYAATKTRRDYVLQRMYVHHDISKAQLDQAEATPVTPRITDTANGCSAAASAYDAGYFCDYVRDQVLQDPAFGKTAAERIETLDTKGLEIHTSLDLDLQAQAQSALSSYVPATMTGVDLGGTNVTVQPGTGRVLSMVQNTTYTQRDNAGPGATAIDYNADTAYGNSGGFQTGSTYKVFTLAEWLASGHTLSESVPTGEHLFQQSEFTNSCEALGGSPWPVSNAEAVPASMSVQAATSESINTAFGAMAKQLDLCKIKDLAQAMGIHQADGSAPASNPASVLGTNPLSPIDLAEAYAGFANGGVVCTPTVIDSVREADGTTVTPTPSSCTRGVSAEVAGTVDHALQGVLTGSGTAASANPGDSTPKFAKTGTTDADTQNWLVTSSTKYTNATWIGNVRGLVGLANTSFPQGTTGYSAKFGVGRSMMSWLDQRYGGGTLPEPDPAMIGSTPRSVDGSASDAATGGDQATPGTSAQAPAAPGSSTADTTGGTTTGAPAPGGAAGAGSQPGAGAGATSTGTGPGGGAQGTGTGEATQQPPSHG
ncbi:penicillin-binding protein [Curtobacterium sp. ODYSSEY 48 V2]|uniref:transglycosylase domain-containing protein n=1 Tax=Curtobacterium sp. ODYSSEY 48 V2 TaxID=2939561 RepID=UPI00203A5EDB|nr:transglycosylase domain-containing protein [Curtobacterium sp. ODYSSEY 48 V2]MCM3504643.1 penicillin-binding protein [Curtobacterium sp. ODYSSEY 48 V2]